MTNDLVIDLRSKRLLDSIGNKAGNLRRLVDAGFRVPVTLVCPWRVQQLWQADRGNCVRLLEAELAKWIQPETLYAVRSSANLEDRTDWSFAGQFTSHLNGKGVQQIVAWIEDIFAQTQSERVKTYFSRNGLDAAALHMAVVIQEMVKQVVSGVAFSRNPVNGAAEVVVEAVRGSGEVLVEGGATPSHWVRRGNRWTVRPDETDIDDVLISDVALQTQVIAKKTRQDIDLEWVYEGRQVYWVQMREITALKSVKVYSNRIARDMLPGMIHPLVWSVNIPIVAGGMIDLLTELTGPNDLTPEQLVKSFHYRTYFEMGTFARLFRSMGLPEQTIEMMLGVTAEPRKMPALKPNANLFKLLPRALRFLWDKTHMDQRFDRELPGLAAEYSAIAKVDLAAMSEGDLLDRVERLGSLVRRCAYLNTLCQLLVSVHILILRRQLTSRGVDFERLDLTAGRQELRQFDPVVHLSFLRQLFVSLPEAVRGQIVTGSYADFRQMLGIESFRQAFDGFMAQFGHLTDSTNDFTVAPWHEHPELILKMVGDQPAGASQADKPKLHIFELPLPAPLKWMLARVYNRMVKNRLYRERMSALYTNGYGLFRGTFLALGQRFVSHGVLTVPEDIFFLYRPEVQALAAASAPSVDWKALARQRRLDMERCREIILPQEIYGDAPLPVPLPATRHMAGIPASQGRYSGKVAVVRGIQDFSKVESGAVLVVPYSDVGWTPLLIKAGAIIAESGGMLSHCSIIAREYGIPAVVSVENATQLADRTLVSVDGYRGEIIVQKSAQ